MVKEMLRQPEYAGVRFPVCRKTAERIIFYPEV